MHIPPNHNVILCVLQQIIPCQFCRRTSKVSTFKPEPVNALQNHNLKSLLEIEKVSEHKPSNPFLNYQFNIVRILCQYPSSIIQISPLAFGPLIYLNLK